MTGASERANAAGLLSEHAALWFKRREPAALETATATARQVVAGLTIPRDPARLTVELKKVRAELQALDTERATIATTAVTLEEATGRVLGIIDGAGEDWRGFSVARFFSADYDPAVEDGDGVLPLDPWGMKGFVVELFSDALKARLLPLLALESEQHTPQLAADERARRLAAVDQKIRTTWFREELICCALEASGVPTDRRGDADVEVVLTVALPEAASASAA